VPHGQTGVGTEIVARREYELHVNALGSSVFVWVDGVQLLATKLPIPLPRGQAGIVGHLEIGDDTAIGAQAGVTENLYGGGWLLSPAVPLAETKQHIAWIRRLGKLLERVKQIEKKLGL
jgi:hypothetical protein